MLGLVDFERPRTLIFETNNIKYSVKFTSFSFYQDKGSTLAQSRLSIYDGENLLLMGSFEEKICLKLTGYLVDNESSHKFIFTSKMFVYVNYDDIFRFSRISRKGEVK